MPRASRRPVDSKLRIELEDNFAFLISSLSIPSDIQQFFEAFLTGEEKTMLTKRLMLHLMIENKYNPSEISSVLGLSQETVYKHKIIYAGAGKQYIALIGKIALREKVKQFWKRVERILRPLDYALGAKSDMKARAKLLSGDYD